MNQKVFEMIMKNPQNFMLCTNDITWDKIIVNKKRMPVLELNSKQYNTIMGEFRIEYCYTEDNGNNYYLIIEELF